MINLNNIKKYDNNATYNSMVDYIKKSLVDVPFIKVETYDIVTLVNSKAYESEVCSISFPDGSHINFKSFSDKVDISRIISNKKGSGRILMTMVIGAYLDAVKNLDNAGDLVLECVGSVGVGKNKRDMPVAQQTAFFRKFGFRKYGKYNPNHIHMCLASNDDLQKTIQFLAN